MKAKIFLPVFFLMIISLVFVSAECTDSDGGLNYNIKGYATGCNDPLADICENVTLPDTCLQWDESNASVWANYGERVQETSCVLDGVDVSDYLCPNGCYDGACADTNSGNFICMNSDRGKICLKPILPEKDHPILIDAPNNFKANTAIMSNLCLGCLKEDTCYPQGDRVTNEFCSENKNFILQLEIGTSCNNNFECSTNFCIDNQCASNGFWQSIVRFFKNLFS